MNLIKLLPLLLAWLVLPSLSAQAGAARIVKTLPHLLDLKGQHTVSPSLYERDAYQVYLRTHPEKRSGLRFDVHWKTKEAAPLTLRIEMRGTDGKESTTAVLEGPLKRSGILGNWSALTLTGDAYKKFGDLVAWRATLWTDGTLVSEQKSFLW